MARDNPMVQHCLELLAPLGVPRARAMFGGHGFYVDEHFIALLADHMLYLKCDAESQPAYDAAGCPPFTFEPKIGRPVVMSYRQAPDDAMESPAAMRPWARLAMASALRAANSKPAARVRKAKANPVPKAR